jgi:tRNA-dihydrouridine synthase B
MVSGKGLWYKDKNTSRLLEIDPEEGPVAYQLFGSEPDIMAYAAEALNDCDNVLLDVNMGCPVPKVVKNGEGSALLRTPDLAGRIIEAMKAATHKSVTAKIRIGWDAASINAVEVAKILADAGADAVCVHGRTREQYYAGKADWDVIGAVKAAVSIPVIGNGDVMNGADAVRMIAYTGCDAVMIARGALGNPWIFAEADAALQMDESYAAPSPAEKTQTFIRHAELVRADKGEHTATLEMRKHVGWYFKGAPGVNRLKDEINKTARLDAVLDEVRAFAAEAYRNCNLRPERL